MSEPTRRGFLVATGGSAAAVAAMSLIGTAEAATDDATGTLDPNGPLVAYIENPRSGRIKVFAGTGSRTVTDRAVVRWLVRSAGGR